MNARVSASEPDLLLPQPFLRPALWEESRHGLTNAAAANAANLADLIDPVKVAELAEPLKVADPAVADESDESAGSPADSAKPKFKALAEKFGDMPLGKSLMAATHVVLNLPDHLRLQRALAHPAIAVRAKTDPEMGYRYLRTTYLGHQFPVRQRLKISVNHFRHLSTFFTEEFITQTNDDGRPLWQARFDDLACDIVLRFPEYYNFDGDLCLAFRVDGKDVYVITFSIAPARIVGARGWQTLLISGIQGINGKIDLIRKATAYCNEVSPPHLLIAAAEALALSLGIRMLVGIGSNPALERDGDAARGRFSFNYDNFWQPIAGDKNASNLYYIPLPFADKPIEAVQSKHRSRALRRRESRNKMRGEIITNASVQLRALCLK